MHSNLFSIKHNIKRGFFFSAKNEQTLYPDFLGQS